DLCGPMPTGQCNSSSAGKICALSTTAWDHQYVQGPRLTSLAKLGNSSVSPNVGHLILKYLCPAVRDILSDGLKAYVLDMIIGQRRNIPWSVVEASTQLGKKKWTKQKRISFPLTEFPDCL
uniref:Uncharacterized protein n=1 Tax=Pavo cristatus TaxID=9049 RepID=A0A8C9FVJ3_PAVCR